MAQTFNDFVAECATYSHSKEHYNIMKECSEIALMEQYIADQVFLKENVAEMTADVTFTESYFMEAASDEQIQALQESVGAKIKKVATSIGNGFKKALAAIIKFFKSLAARLTKTSGEARALYKELKDLNMTSEQYEDLAKQLVASESNCGLAIEKGQSYVVELGVKGNLPVKYHKYFAVALADTNVQLGLKDKDDVIDAKVLVKILKKFSKDKKKYDFETTVKSIELAREDARKNGVTVYANDKAVEKLVAALEEVAKLVEERKPDQALEDDVQNADKMADAWVMINSTVAATTKQYGAYLKYRAEAMQKIKAFITSTKNATGSAKSAEEASSSTK